MRCVQIHCFKQPFRSNLRGKKGSLYFVFRRENCTPRAIRDVRLVAAVFRRGDDRPVLIRDPRVTNDRLINIPPCRAKRLIKRKYLRSRRVDRKPTTLRRMTSLKFTELDQGTRGFPFLEIRWPTGNDLLFIDEFDRLESRRGLISGSRGGSTRENECFLTHFHGPIPFYKYFSSRRRPAQ